MTACSGCGVEVLGDLSNTADLCSRCWALKCGAQEEVEDQLIEEGLIDVRRCARCGEEFRVLVDDPQLICRICFWLGRGE